MKVELRPITLQDKDQNDLVLPGTMKVMNEDTTMITPTFVPARGHGLYVIGETRREIKRLVIGGSLYLYGKDTLQALKDDILAIISNPPVEVIIAGRTLFCYPDGDTFRQLQNFTELQPEFRLNAYDPFWYGEEETESGGSITVGGNFKTAPLLTVTEASNFTVSSSLGYSITLTGMNTPTVINNKAMTIFDNTGNKTGSGSSTWLVHGFWLHPGVQTVTTNSGSLTIKYRDCYA